MADVGALKPVDYKAASHARTAADKWGRDQATRNRAGTISVKSLLQLAISYVMIVLGDIDPEITDAVCALNVHTVGAPLAPLTGQPRYNDVVDTCYGLLAPGDNDVGTIQALYASPAWEVTRSWQDIGLLIPQLDKYLRLATRLLLGCLGYEGRLHQAVSHLDEYAFLDMVGILATLYHVVSQSSVATAWADFMSIGYNPALPVTVLFNEVAQSGATLKSDGAALKQQRKGPTPRQELQLFLTALEEAASDRGSGSRSTMVSTYSTKKWSPMLMWRNSNARLCAGILPSTVGAPRPSVVTALLAPPTQVWLPALR